MGMAGWKDGGAVDRCALFVDAGYVLADGAMAVHGTRRGESVSWDYEGLLQLLSSLARERSGLPLLRCYWYETSVDGRRTAEHDALADLPGIKLRLAKIRPGRREGVETEIHRDLTTLARNNAVSDALVVSAEEDLAQVIADVQDLGMRVTLVHIAVDGNWTISRTLRQESDDIIEIGGEHLRPYVELIAGAEPAIDETDGPARSNGHLAGVGAYQAGGNHVPPSIYTAPVVAEYQRPALQLPRASPNRDPAPREITSREITSREPATREPAARDADRSRDERIREERPVVDQVAEPPAAPGGQLRRLPTRTQTREARDSREVREIRDTDREREPVTPQPAQRSAAHSLAQHGSGAHGLTSRDGGRETSRDASRENGRDASRENASRENAREGSRESAPNGAPASASARSAPYSGPQPVMTSGYHPQPAVSLADAVQAAHEEGQDFGESVARDAPALWLEAVLARKPRMPSDLEARLLQGSALPIDFLLHDEVRHALRRGFWDALERTRR
jgi:NYN domain-containing protein